jgi:uncharacterized protein (DUF697 family)
MEELPVDITDANTKTADAGWLTKSLVFVWEKVIIGDNKFNPEKSCYQLAAEYTDSGKTAEQCARNFIKWQTGKAGITGFALGLPGFTAMPVTIPADLASVSYLQLRMIAVIGILFGWEVTSDQFRTVAFTCLLGTAVGEAAHDVGVKASARFGARFVRNIPGRFLQRVNELLHVHNLFIKGVNAGANAGGKATATAGAKVGSKGIINLSKMVPLFGGIVGGGLNAVFTRQMGVLAVRLLKGGPPDGGQARPIEAAAPAGHDGADGPTIDEVADVVEDFVSSLPEEYTTHEAEPGGRDASIEGATERA